MDSGPETFSISPKWGLNPMYDCGQAGFGVMWILSFRSSFFEFFRATVSDFDETSVKIFVISTRVQRFENRGKRSSYAQVMVIFVQAIFYIRGIISFLFISNPNLLSKRRHLNKTLAQTVDAILA